MQLIVNRWRSRVKKVTRGVLNVALPPVCVNCKKPGGWFCKSCYAEIEWIGESICLKCGRLLPQMSHECEVCKKRPLSIQQIRAAVIYAEPISSAIHKMKYEHLFGIAEPLASLMAQAWIQWQRPVHLILPIPLHPEREKKRGYNQSTLLAKWFSHEIDLPFNEKILKRIRHTPPQVGLNAVERMHNVSGAFEAEHSVAGKDILLIDDVCTTGATMAYAAAALYDAGATSVSGYCLARAM